jgi:hypothetical protein
MRALFYSIVSVALLSVNPAQAKRCRGVDMPERLEIDGKQLQLNGMGLREATILNIDVYVAGLYVEQRSSDGKKLASSETTKQVKLVLLRDVSRKDLAEQMGTYFRHAAGPDYDKLKQRFDRLSGWLPALQEGDTFSVTYRPGAGLTVRHGKKTLGTIAGADFARAIFSIWLGDKPPNEGLKLGLLGGACG